MIGMFVKLKRSRKAPNGVWLEVVDTFEGGEYSEDYNAVETDKIAVLVDKEVVWVNATCVSEKSSLVYGCVL